MNINYDKLWKLLIDRKMTKSELRVKAGITTNALARMGKQLPITLESIGKICTALGCTTDDILSFDAPAVQSKEETK